MRLRGDGSCVLIYTLRQDGVPRNVPHRQGASLSHAADATPRYIPLLNYLVLCINSSKVACRRYSHCDWTQSLFMRCQTVFPGSSSRLIIRDHKHSDNTRKHDYQRICSTYWRRCRRNIRLGNTNKVHFSVYPAFFTKKVVEITIKYLNNQVTVHHLVSWIKRDQLDVTCFIISLFNAQHVSDVNTSILRSLRLICRVI